MRNVLFCLIIGILFFGCSEENPSTIFVNSPNDESSSSIFVESSSSEEFGLSSSSFDIFSCSSEISSSTWAPYSYGELIDERDGQVYKTIKIGEQTWMAENLNYAYLQPTSTKDSSSECFNNEPDTCAKYGRLYLWSAAMDSAAIFSLDGKGCGLGSGSCKAQPSKGVRGVCPENWHIPTESDMNNYINYANSSLDSLNSVRYYWFDRFIQLDYTKPNINQKYAFLWSSVDLYGEKFNENSIKVIDFTDINNLVGIDLSYRADSHAIRCVKDDEKFHVEHGTMTDERDGQVYKTVKIGDQWWMAENLNYAYTVPIKNLEYPLDSASFCYNNDPDYCFKYGRLYVWKAAMDCENNNNCKNYNDDLKSRGICPEKWHIPSVNEWKTLIDIANNFAIDLKSTKEWLDDGNGSNVFGFNVLPAGFIDNTGHETYHYSSTVHEIWYPNESAGKYTCFGTRVPFSYSFCVGTKCGDFEGNNAVCFSSKERDVIYPEEMENYFALSVRCVKDN